MGVGSSLFRVFSHECVPYEEARRRIRTGDLVYMFTFHQWTSFIITVFSGRLCSHMGMAVVCEDGHISVLEAVRHHEDIPDELYATAENRHAATSSLHGGVRLVPLERKLSNPDATYYVWIQPLHVRDSERAQCVALLAQFMREVDCRPYERDILGMVLAPLNGPSYEEEGDVRAVTSYYCSKLVACAYQAMGLLDSRCNVSRVWHTAFLNRELPLLRGAFLDAGGFYVRTTATAKRRLTPPPSPLPTTAPIAASIAPTSSSSAVAAAAAVATPSTTVATTSSRPDARQLANPEFLRSIARNGVKVPLSK